MSNLLKTVRREENVNKTFSTRTATARVRETKMRLPEKSQETFSKLFRQCPAELPRIWWSRYRRYQNPRNLASRCIKSKDVHDVLQNGASACKCAKLHFVFRCFPKMLQTFWKSMDSLEKESVVVKKHRPFLGGVGIELFLSVAPTILGQDTISVGLVFVEKKKEKQCTK